VDVEKCVTVTIDTPDGERALRFQVDRIEEVGGERIYTDWKTGNLGLTNTTDAARARQYAQKLAAGRLLQGHAYALTGARARYVHLDPKHDDALRVIEADAGGAQQAAFEASVATLFAARDAGAFPPRLRAAREDKEPRMCSTTCDVRQACLRGDSGVRRRIDEWFEAAAAAGEPATSSIERAALALWKVSE